MKRICALAIAAALVFSAWGCTQTPYQSAEVEINPVEGAAKSERTDVTLYFADAQYSGLVGCVRSIETPVTERREYAILNALIQGVAGSDGGNVTSLINPKTTVVSVTDSNNILFVTLSREFLDWSDFASVPENAEVMLKYLAVFSIVDTLIELSGYPRVQLLVDMNDSGTGQRVKRSDVGLGGAGVLEPLDRNGSIILSPGNAINGLFDGVMGKDGDKIYDFIAYNDGELDEKPSVTTLKTEIQASGLAIESYSLRDTILGADGKTAVVMADYTTRAQNGDVKENTNIPIPLIREDGVWRITYSVLKRIFLEGGGA